MVMRRGSALAAALVILFGAGLAEVTVAAPQSLIGVGLPQLFVGDADTMAQAGVSLSHAREMGRDGFIAWVHDEDVTAAAR